MSGTTSHEIEEKLEKDLKNVHHWLLANKLILKVSKTEYMLIGSKQKLSQVTIDPALSIDSDSINRFSSTKTLGVIVDECITWRDHIDQVAKKASKGIGFMRRSKDLLNTNTLKAVYDALILPHFDYCALVWEIVQKLYKPNYRNFKTKQLEFLQVIATKHHQILSEWETLLSRREKQMTLY